MILPVVVICALVVVVSFDSGSKTP